MPPNSDLSPPEGKPAKTPIDFGPLYDGSFKTYWVDEQIINEDLSYTFNQRMPRHATLHIPKVVRFLHTYADDKDIAAEWCSAGSGETPCGSKSWVFESEETGVWGVDATEALLIPYPGPGDPGPATPRYSLEFLLTEVGTIAYQYNFVFSDETFSYYQKKSTFILQCLDAPVGGGDG